MRKAVKRALIMAGAALWSSGLPALSVAKIEGECSDCHTMHNSEQGEPVVVVNREFDLLSPLPNEFLLRMDCVSCHAQGGSERIVIMGSGSQVPQVYHTDAAGDLAAGNFAYISGSKTGVGEPGSRKGHDVVDLGLLDDTFTKPPGFRHADTTRFQVESFTCAGVNGCHGWRNRLMKDDRGNLVPRRELAAISGSHHANEDGMLHQADTVANSYRFLLGLFGLENPDPNSRWQNVGPESHNEYYGVSNPHFGAPGGEDCFDCHVGSTEATVTSYITTPNHSMSGFCTTCHRDFHSTSVPGSTAFLRHPSDFVIKNEGEYAEYTVYELTAPVARPSVFEIPGSDVQPGRDLVMCLSCHLAHAGPYEGMLRFDYAGVIAGGAGEATGRGCLACHTSKGG